MRDLARSRPILEQLRLAGPRWHTPELSDDGATLWNAVCEHELEGVVAKRRSGRYLPGERGWIKTKNRDYWRYDSSASVPARVCHRARVSAQDSQPIPSRLRSNPWEP